MHNLLLDKKEKYVHFMSNWREKGYNYSQTARTPFKSTYESKLQWHIGDESLKY